MKNPVKHVFEDINSAIHNNHKSNNVNKSSSFHSDCMRLSSEKICITYETNHIQSVSYSHTSINVT